jgi:hypothetical protein
MFFTTLHLQGNMKDNVEYNSSLRLLPFVQSSKPTSITLTFEDMQGTSIDLSIEMSEHVQLVQKRGQKY